MPETKEQLQQRLEAAEKQNAELEAQIRAPSPQGTQSQEAMLEQLAQQDSEWLLVPAISDDLTIIQAKGIAVTGKKSVLLRSFVLKGAGYEPQPIQVLQDVHARPMNNNTCVLEATA